MLIGSGAMITARKAISDLMLRSLNSDQINDIGRGFDSDFDVRRISGFGDKIRVPTQIAIDCVFEQFPEEGKLMRFLGYMLSRNGSSASGGIVKLRDPERTLNQLRGLDWVYDRARGRFQKDQSINPTPDWGFLLEGEEYRFGFASIAVADWSNLLNKNLKSDVDQSMTRLHAYVKTQVESWNGRLWSWGGEGGLAAFHGDDAGSMLTMCMISVLAFLTRFNIFENDLSLETEISLRIGAHFGGAVFKADTGNIFSPDPELALELRRKHSATNSVTVSEALYTNLRSEIAGRFRAAGSAGDTRLYRFSGMDGGL